MDFTISHKKPIGDHKNPENWFSNAKKQCKVRTFNGFKI